MRPFFWLLNKYCTNWKYNCDFLTDFSWPEKSTYFEKLWFQKKYRFSVSKPEERLITRPEESKTDIWSKICSLEHICIAPRRQQILLKIPSFDYSRRVLQKYTRHELKILAKIILVIQKTRKIVKKFQNFHWACWVRRSIKDRRSVVWSKRRTRSLCFGTFMLNRSRRRLLDTKHFSSPKSANSIRSVSLARLSLYSWNPVIYYKNSITLFRNST